MLQAVKNLALRTGQALGAFHLSRLRTTHGVRILGYHGFCTSDASDFQPMLFMRPEIFLQRMRNLVNGGYRVIPLTEALARLEAADVAPDTVVITIDDGWQGVSAHAAPILRQLGLPATLYVSTYYVDSQIPVMNVLLRYILWRAQCGGADPGKIRSVLTEMIGLDQPPDPIDPVHQLSSHADNLPVEKREAFAVELADRFALNIRPVLQRRTFHFLNEAELRDIAASGIDLQLHTHRHRFPLDSRNDCVAEIEQNRNSLQVVSTRPLTHFCYPSGRYDPQQLPWLRAIGIESAVTTRYGICSSSTDRLQLPRFLDSNAYSSAMFEAGVSGFLEIARSVGLGRNASD